MDQPFGKLHTLLTTPPPSSFILLYLIRLNFLMQLHNLGLLIHPIPLISPPV